MRNLFKEMPDFTCNHDLHKCEITYKANGKETTIDAFFTDERISDKDMPKGLFKYEIRSADDSEDWSTIEPKVGVNHIATIVVDTPIEFEVHENNDCYNDIVEVEADYGDDDDDDYPTDLPTRIYDSQYGEVKLRQTYDCDTDTYPIDCYIGDNYDEYVGEIYCDINDDEEIERQLSEIL